MARNASARARAADCTVAGFVGFRRTVVLAWSGAAGSLVRDVANDLLRLRYPATARVRSERPYVLTPVITLLGFIYSAPTVRLPPRLANLGAVSAGSHTRFPWGVGL